LVCGICVALNLLTYLPRKAVVEAEATEFTVTVFLLLVFIVASLLAAISTLKNRGDRVLVSQLLLTVAFVMVSIYGHVWEWKMSIALQLSYAVLVLTFGTIGLLANRRQAT